MREKEKMLITSIFSFPTMFSKSPLSERITSKFIILYAKCHILKTTIMVVLLITSTFLLFPQWSQPKDNHINSFLHTEEKSFRKTLWKKVKLLKMSNFTFFHNVFYAIRILKSFSSHISVVICSFSEFGMVTKWCIREWVKKTLWKKVKLLILSNFTFFHNVFFAICN